MVRWGDLERAEQFVDPDHLAEFKRAASGFDKLRVTDHEIGEIEYSEDRTAHVTVTYKGYSIAHLVEHTSRERQEWVRTGVKNHWQVRPQLDVVLAELQGLRAASTGN
jgi:transposase